MVWLTAIEEDCVVSYISDIYLYYINFTVASPEGRREFPRIVSDDTREVDKL